MRKGIAFIMAAGMLATGFTLDLISGNPNSTPSTQAANTNTVRLKVLSFNILGGRNTDGQRDLNKVAKVIRALDPDLVALQEVDRHTQRIQGVDIPRELARLTGMQAVFGRAMPYDGGEYGEAVLSRYPVLSSTNHPLPHLPDSEPRAALAVNIQPSEAREVLTFVGTHLDHQRRSTDRLMQARAIDELYEANDPRPMVLAGDLNDIPNSETLGILKRQWTDTWNREDPGLSYSSAKPRIKIDYIMVRPTNRWRVVKTYLGNELHKDDKDWQDLLKTASDHLPVIAELELIQTDLR